MKKRIILTVIGVLGLAAITVRAAQPVKRARIKGLVIPLDDDLECVYENCLELSLGPGFVGVVRSSSKPGYVRLYPDYPSDKSLINNRSYILVREDQIIYL